MLKMPPKRPKSATSSAGSKRKGKTGDKSSEVTARMNLSDLRLVEAGSPTPTSTTINTNTNSSALPASFHGYPNLSGAKSPLRRRGSAETLELSSSPDKNRTGDSSTHTDWEEEVFPGSSKNNTIKASTKMFLFHRLKSKKQKNNKSSPKDKHERSTEHSTPQLDAPVSPKVFLNTVDCPVNQHPWNPQEAYEQC